VHRVDHIWFIVTGISRLIELNPLNVKAWCRHEY